MLKKIEVQKLRKNKFSLILSGGAVLGLAHIGVIRWLEENKLIPDEIIGTSMGAVIGSLYCVGYSSKEIEKILEIVERNKLFRLNFSRKNIQFPQITELLNRVFGETQIKESKIPLKIIATNLKSGSAKMFGPKTEEKISQIVNASIAIPGVFEAKKIQDKYYVDGGVSSNLGVEFAKMKNIKIASNVVNKKIKFHFREPKGFFSHIRERVITLETSMHYLLRNQTYTKIQYIKKLFLIEPDLSKYRVYRLKNTKKIIQKGYDSAKEIIV